MTRKQARKQSVGMCQTMTLSVIAFLFVFAGIFSAQLARAEEGDTTSDTSSEVSDSSESNESSENTSETSEEPVTEDAPETAEEVSEGVASFEMEADDSEIVIEEVVVESTETVVEEIFEMFSSFEPLLVMEDIPATSSAAILTPSMNEDIHGVYTFTAEYNNPSFMGPYGLRWAIRADGLCDGDTPAVPVFGNVDGATTSPAHTAGAFGEHTSGDNTVSWNGSFFEAVLDFTGLDEGEYCFAFNPNPKDSHRQTVLFNHVIPTTGSIVVTKDVQFEDDTTSFELTLSDGSEMSQTNFVSESDDAEFNDLMPGTYTLEEVDIAGYYLVSMTSGETTDVEGRITVQVVAGETTEIHIVNAVEEECVECEMEFGTLVINKNVIDKDGDDISDNTEFNVMIAPYRVEVRSSPVEVTISEDAPASIELPTGTYSVCEMLEEGSDYVIVVDEEFEMDSESPVNCQFIKLGEAGESITFTNQKMTEEETGRRPGRRHTTGGQVLGAFTGDSSTGGSCGMYLNSYMRIGANNNQEEVMKLQAFLNEQGYSIPVNGTFGSATEAAVKAFQKTHAAEILAPWGLTDPTGYVYKMTRYVMNNMVCPGSEAKPTL